MNSGRSVWSNIKNWFTLSAQISINTRSCMRYYVVVFHVSFNRNSSYEKMSIVASVLLGNVSNKLGTLSWFRFIWIERIPSLVDMVWIRYKIHVVCEPCWLYLLLSNSEVGRIIDIFHGFFIYEMKMCSPMEPVSRSGALHKSSKVIMYVCRHKHVDFCAWYLHRAPLGAEGSTPILLSRSTVCSNPSRDWFMP